MQVRFKNISASLRKHQTKIMLFTAFLFLLLGAVVATAADNSQYTNDSIVITSTTAFQTTTTTIPPVTTTTTTIPDYSGVDWNGLRQMEIDSMRQIYGKCGEYHDLAIQVGWPEEEWPRLQQVMWRESRCITDSWNGADAGLTQINQVHSQWLSDMGWSHPDDMFNPEYNLTFALRLWETSGWKPWRFSGTTWGD